MKAISLRDVTLAANQVDILNDITVDINMGQSVAITGPSGSGKSSILAIMAGLMAASTGHVALLGQDMTRKNDAAIAKLRRHAVGIVFQAFHLVPTLNVLQNVAVAARLSGDKSYKKSAEEMLARVGLEARLRHFPQTLSGGEQQRVAVARALVTSPQVLFADEPTGNLDRKSSNAVSDLLFDLPTEGKMTRIIATHDPRLAERCAREITIEDGRIVSDTGT